ncbi:hypothetical protein [Streptomyces sp. NPDC017940]|uniref:hypothetical protein n=1 Tax=Streptomyces sp. NPDC017940 TaxID=3365017 RepID=UPI0037B37452
MTNDIPKEIKESVSRRVYAQAHARDWTRLPAAERSLIYDQWVDAPDVGGKLIQYRGTPSRVRHWLKDGPMKEYARAIYGVGTYASYVPDPSAGVVAVIEKALGEGWAPVPGTQRTKPLRITVSSGEEEKNFAWADDSKQLKHLVWAALRAEANGVPNPWILCLVEMFEAPIPAEEKAEHIRIGERAGLLVKHVSLG